MLVHFFVRHKGPWLSGFSLTQQPKRVALSLKGFKKRRPAAWPKGSPRENHKHGGVTNSYPPAGLRHVTPCFRVYELRSAALQRVLKPKIIIRSCIQCSMLGVRCSTFIFQWFFLTLSYYAVGGTGIYLCRVCKTKAPLYKRGAFKSIVI